MSKLSEQRRAAEYGAAEDYAAAIRSHSGRDAHFWRSLNTDIVARWSHTALLRIKRRAWQIIEAEVPSDAR